MKLRVGLVGLGDVWHQRHAPALRMLADRFEVRVVCDQVGHRAKQAAQEFGATSVDGFRALARREDIDAGMRLGCNHPMGPLELLDHIGLDTALMVCEALHAEYASSEYAAPPLLRRMVAAGRLGRKSGRGFYEYPA